ncbi:PAN-1 domain and Apple-like domain-containing protein [Strongyloides ratti]|uniref:PAN-1 domain and Apple-like domain-containing protein n=1 Tax=Strongyloides ratti TaxID=34506 RepID=A0A090MZF3_STRRB|nr:PAN-1 domain and Apple-like domain-containing protein [Strongyloides ratti]CEF68834.1 PAN-1 domain and Apple-like domain-containing protein [Strongyloides ratti]
MNTAKVKTEKVAICLQLCMNYREALSKKLVIKTLKDSCNLVLDKKNNLIPYKKNFNENILKDSPTLDSCFEEYPGKVLIGVVDQLIKDITSKEQCKQICFDTKLLGDLECKAAMYYTKDQTCVLSSETKTTMPELFTSDVDSTYLENKCLKKIINTNNNIKSKEISTVPESNKDILLNVITSTITSPIQITSINPKIKENVSNKDKVPQQQELSGYDSSDPTITGNEVKNILSTPSKNIPVIDSRVIDSYNPSLATTSKPEMSVNLNEKKILENYILPELTTMKPSLGVDDYNLPLPSTVKPFMGVSENQKIISNNVPDIGYRKMYRLRDEVLSLAGTSDGCFVSISPRILSPDVIVKSSSIKQCLEMCKLCKDCINGKDKCQMISFSLKTNHCALSAKINGHVIDKPNINVALLHFKISNCPQIKN